MIWIVWGITAFLLFTIGIKFLKKMQFNQRIYELGPSEHQKKSGTPTLGGSIIFVNFLLGIFFLYRWELIFQFNVAIIWVILAATLFFLIGFIDDVKSLKNKTNKGLSAKGKFILQIIVSIVLIYFLNRFIYPVSFIEWFIYVFLLTGTSNATNLTDGVDGLLSGTMMASLSGVTYILFEMWRFEEAYIVMILMASIGMFLIFNWNPAKIFMGDSGSLMLGGFLAAICIVTGKWWMLVGFGAMYVVETLSVIIQVFSYKFRKKRIFLMTPLHHHFELLGFSEVSVTILFIICQSILTIVQIL